MYKVVHRFTDERISFEVFAKHRIAIYPQAARRGHVVSRFRVIESLKRPADGIHSARILPGRHTNTRTRRGHVRIASQIMIRKRVVPGERAVIATEPLAP